MSPDKYRTKRIHIAEFEREANAWLSRQSRDGYELYQSVATEKYVILIVRLGEDNE